MSAVGSRGGAARLWQWVTVTDRFVRLHFVFFTCVWPLLGAASVRRDSNPATLALLLAAIATFHIYTFVLNDLLDLPLDRTEPARQQDPLVRGQIKPWQAGALVAVQPLLSVPFTIGLGGGWQAHASLASAFVLMGAYNVWGKRCAVPPLTDAIQGLAWGSLAVYAAYALGRPPGPLTWSVVAYGTLFTLFMNGIHGGLRDLTNDFAHGARTTAIWLGARPSTGGEPFVPRAVAVFAMTVLGGLVGLNAMLLWRNDFDYSPPVLAAVAVVVAVLNLSALGLMPKVARPRAREWDAAFRLQMYMILMSLPVAFAPYASGLNLFLLALLNAISVVLLGRVASISRWAWLTIRSSARTAQSEETLPDGITPFDN